MLNHLILVTILSAEAGFYNLFQRMQITIVIVSSLGKVLKVDNKAYHTVAYILQ